MYTRTSDLSKCNNLMHNCPPVHLIPLPKVQRWRLRGFINFMLISFCFLHYTPILLTRFVFWFYHFSFRCAIQRGNDNTSFSHSVARLVMKTITITQAPFHLHTIAVSLSDWLMKQCDRPHRRFQCKCENCAVFSLSNNAPSFPFVASPPHLQLFSEFRWASINGKIITDFFTNQSWQKYIHT